MRRPVIAANWKMHLTAGEARALAEQLRAGCRSQAEQVDIIVCPPFTALAETFRVLKGSGLAVGGQNMHWQDQGAYTGEISPPMLKDAGCSHVIVGHSERRQLFGEDDAGVNHKVRAALRHGLTPIFCLGETLAQREQGDTEAICVCQLEQGLAGLEPDEIAAVIIAYEPVWAIGTGRTATPADAQATISFIRRRLAKSFGSPAARTRILYGGSVKATNIAGLMAEADIDGALVGGASLEAASFMAIAGLGVQR